MSNASSTAKPKAASKAAAEQPPEPTEAKWHHKLLRKGSSGGFGGPLRVTLTAIAIFILSQFIAAFIVELLYNITGADSRAATPISQSVITQFLFIVIAEGLAIWMVLKVIKRRGLSLAAIGLGRRPQWSDLKWASLGFLVFYGLLVAISVVLTILIPDLNIDQQQDVGFDQLIGSGEKLLALIGLVLLPPLGEEVLVRGYLYSGLRSKLKFVPAMLLTSLFFGAAHFQTDASGSLVWAVAADTFLLSLVLVYLREKTGVLYAAIGVHVLNNLVAYFVHFYS